MKIANKVLLIGISVAIFSLLFLLIITLSSPSNQVQFKSILIGDLVGFTNFLLGLVFLFIGINRPDKIFLMSFYGGILFRLFILSVIVVIIIKTLEINVNNFIFSLLFFYFFYLTVEIIYLNFRKR
jgi:hypothetical protein